MRVFFLIACVIGLSADLQAQTAFSWQPNDSIVQDVDPNLYTEMLIEQENLTGDTLNLGVEVVYNDAPASWDGMICIQGSCLGSIQPVGFTAQMSPLTDSIKGYAKLTVYPAGGTESMKLRIRVYDLDNPSDGDTCTWIVNSVASSVVEEDVSAKISLYPNPVQDQFTLSASSFFTVVKVLDVQGKEVICQSFQPTKQRQLKLEGVKAGVYFLKVLDDASLLGTKKVILQ